MTDANEIAHTIINVHNIYSMINAGMLGDDTTKLERSLTNYIDKCIVDQIEREL